MLSIEPARQSPLADPGTFVYEFQPRDIAALIEAADYFRDNYVLLDRTIRGLVKRLDRVPQAEAGSVTITAPLVGGHDKNITVQLNEVDYIEAIHAHEDKVLVECSGDIYVSPRSARLLNPKGFKVFRNGQLFNDA